MNSHNVSCISFATSSQDHMILHFSLATTPQLFRHFQRMPSGSIGDLSVYCVVILIKSCYILFKDCIHLSWLFLGLGCFSYVTKALSSWSWGNNCRAHRRGGGRGGGGMVPGRGDDVEAVRVAAASKKARKILAVWRRPSKNPPGMV
jgi:hypothetical protein